MWVTCSHPSSLHPKTAAGGGGAGMQRLLCGTRAGLRALEVACAAGRFCFAFPLEGTEIINANS